ncbi:hypothetical protein FB459_2876 [Yimella lutea]|uniref:Scaffolding protein n=1 Tax=Yimella lutea TaxID=587872 RepID=A0A542EJ16_9MICO|nr:hypothetical protein [Yimella lutea]TQJ15330.1 hypothetical protein FB459_2876 [Yimella lutea]
MTEQTKLDPTDETSDDTQGEGAASTTTKPAPGNGPLTHTEPEGEGTEGDERTEDDREAARYRRKLRAAEGERDTLRATVERLQRAEVERLAGVHLSKPEGLWAAGVSLADVLDEDGNADAEKITQACRDASDRLGLSRPRPGNIVPKEGRNPEMRGDTGFSGAFAPQF